MVTELELMRSRTKRGYGAKGSSKKPIPHRPFVIGTSKGKWYARLNPQSPGGGRGGHWFHDVADNILIHEPKTVRKTVGLLNWYILEDIIHAEVIVHGWWVKELSISGNLWFTRDENFDEMLRRLLG